MNNLCTMCEQVPATTTYGFSVCQSCYDELFTLDAELKSMEAVDPELAEAGRRAEEALKMLNDSTSEPTL